MVIYVIVLDIINSLIGFFYNDCLLINYIRRNLKEKLFLVLVVVNRKFGFIYFYFWEVNNNKSFV